MEKRAQNGTNAAILIAVLSAFIIIYIMFLPASQREDLLEGDGSSIGSSVSQNKIVLLKESVGRLDPGAKVRDKTLPNVNIFESTNAKVLEEFSPITIRNGWFVKKSRTASFTLQEPENIDNVFLSFSAPIRKGILSIFLNNGLIFEFRVSGIDAGPIKIKKSLLKKENELVFMVSSVGAKFWDTNEYSLADIRLIGDITDISKQASQNAFSITDKEIENIEKAELRFIPYCSSTVEAGNLDARINGESVFSAVPVCNDRYVVDIPLAALREGSNKLLFRAQKGSFSIEQIKLSFTQKEVPESVFFFEVNETTFRKIGDGRNQSHNAFLELEFVDDSEVKRADINLNDRFIRIDQDKKGFRKQVTSLIEEGNNFIKIIPRNIVEIVEVKIQLERR